MHHHPNYPSSPVRGCHHTLAASTSISEDPLEKIREKDHCGDDVGDVGDGYNDRVILNVDDDDDGASIAGGEDDGDSAMRILRVMVRYSVVTAVIMLMRAVRMR